MKAEAQKALEEEEMSLAQVLSEKSIRWQLISICLMMLCQQLSGINAVFFYTNKIFDAAGYAESTQLKLSGLAQNLYTVFGLHVLWVFFSVRSKDLESNYSTDWCIERCNDFYFNVPDGKNGPQVLDGLGLRNHDLFVSSY